MYPYLHDFFNDIFGTSWSLPFPMFGFWVAMAFIAANYTFTLELKRKEGLGQLHGRPEKRIIGAKVKTFDLLINGLFGFILGYKIVEAFFNYEELVSDPPGFLLSSRGDMIGGILGAALAAYLKYREGKKNELPEPKTVEEMVHPYQHVGNMTLIAALAGILGAKIFHNLENIEEFMADPIDALLAFSGLSIYGGLIIGGGAVVYYAYKKQLNVVHIIDACAPGLMLAYGVGRIGCQLSGDGDWGIPNDAPMPEWLSFLPEWMWAYDYPNNVNGVNLIEDFARMGMVSETGKAFPTPFYETVMALIIFGILWKLRKKITTPGVLFSIYLMFVGAERFLIEKIRINPPYDLFGMEVTQAEIISVVLIIAGGLGIYWARKIAGKKSEPVASA